MMTASFGWNIDGRETASGTDVKPEVTRWGLVTGLADIFRFEEMGKSNDLLNRVGGDHRQTTHDIASCKYKQRKKFHHIINVDHRAYYVALT